MVSVPALQTQFSIESSMHIKAIKIFLEIIVVPVTFSFVNATTLYITNKAAHEQDFS
jgi:hypothetical protein